MTLENKLQFIPGSYSGVFYGAHVEISSSVMKEVYDMLIEGGGALDRQMAACLLTVIKKVLRSKPGETAESLVFKGFQML